MRALGGMAGLLLGALIALPAGAVGLGIAEPDTYRTEQYRAPVPDTLTGATVVDTDAAHALWQSGVAFVDVMPHRSRPKELPEGVLWIDRKRETIPGAIWAPNTGYGRILPEVDAYLRAVLEQATGGDPATPVVIFCKADCWMSWNAARRAVLEYGYSAVHWYPDGTDGWDFADHPLEPVQPAE